MIFNYGEDITKYKIYCVKCKKIIERAYMLINDLSDPKITTCIRCVFHEVYEHNQNKGKKRYIRKT